MTVIRSEDASDTQILKLHAERVQVERQIRETGSVRVTVATNHRDHLVDELLTSTGVTVEHVPIGQFVEQMPEIREEGDVVVIPVVEEVVVTRLLLREEVRITRTSSQHRYQKTVSLRAEEAIVTRERPDAAEATANPEETIHGQ